MKVADFDFDLPEDRIALRPARPRDAARMLRVASDGAMSDLGVRDLVSVLAPGDCLVLNDTLTLRAALSGVRPARATGGGGPALVHFNLFERAGDASWRAFARPAKRLRAGDVLDFGAGLTGEVARLGGGGEVELAFTVAGAALDAAIEAAGAAPLPPYIARRRPADAHDLADYQTVFAAAPGSVAAPTAGLHFTPELLSALDQRGVTSATVTLHVGAGTFLPVTADDTVDHAIHSEERHVSQEAADAVNAARARGGRIVAVGTTALRTLESAVGADGRIASLRGPTDLFIKPGFTFRAVDVLMTNFHLPRSTLFMLVCAFSGSQVMKRAYAHAVATGYRFYSYGDACLLERSASAP